MSPNEQAGLAIDRKIGEALEDMKDVATSKYPRLRSTQLVSVGSDRFFVVVLAED